MYSPQHPQSTHVILCHTSMATNLFPVGLEVWAVRGVRPLGSYISWNFELFKFRNFRVQISSRNQNSVPALCLLNPNYKKMLPLGRSWNTWLSSWFWHTRLYKEFVCPRFNTMEAVNPFFWPIQLKGHHPLIKLKKDLDFMFSDTWLPLCHSSLSKPNLSLSHEFTLQTFLNHP